MHKPMLVGFVSFSITLAGSFVGLIGVVVGSHLGWGGWALALGAFAALAYFAFGAWCSWAEDRDARSPDEAMADAVMKTVDNWRGREGK